MSGICFLLRTPMKFSSVKGHLVSKIRRNVGILFFSSTWGTIRKWYHTNWPPPSSPISANPVMWNSKCWFSADRVKQGSQSDVILAGPHVLLNFALRTWVMVGMCLGHSSLFLRWFLHVVGCSPYLFRTYPNSACVSIYAKIAVLLLPRVAKVGTPLPLVVWHHSRKNNI